MDDAPSLGLPSFFPRADQHIPHKKAQGAALCALESAGRCSAACGHTLSPLSPWSPDGQIALCLADNPHDAPAAAGSDPTDRYLVPSLARNERHRLTMFWYYTFDILNNAELIARLAEKTQLAAHTAGWDIALVGLVDMNTFTRIASQGILPAVMPRRETPCAHIVNQAPDSVLLVPDMLEDWRFAHSPTAQHDGTRAYAATPLHFRTDSGESLMFGSLCVAAKDRQEPLVAAQRASLARLADWCVADIVHSARTRRQQQRRRMTDLLGHLTGQATARSLQDVCLAIVRSIYPHATVSLQPLRYGEIEVEGRRAVLLRDFEDNLWEDSEYIQSVIDHHNHEVFPSHRVVRIIAAPCQIDGGIMALVVRSKEFNLVFDDIDSWFVLACADILSRDWQQRLLLDAKNARDQFLRSITHSLRTPMHGILGSVDLLQEEYKLRNADRMDTSFPPVGANSHTGIAKTTIAQTHLDIIKSASQSLISMVNSIITWNRWTEISDSERAETLMDTIEFENQLLAGAAKQALEAKNDNVFLVIRSILPESYDGIIIDIDLCKEAVIPVVLNALQNTTSGGIIITVSTCADQRKLIVEVQDTGSGLKLADQSRIFGAFEKGDTYGVGAGLGLTLSSKFAGLLGGDVQLVASTPGRGSHFRLEFQAVSFACHLTPVDSWLASVTSLPRRFRHAGSNWSESSPAQTFGEFLLHHGFTVASDDEDAVVILEAENDAEDLVVVPSHISASSVVVCFLPNILTPENRAGQASNVLQVVGPVTTSTLISTVQQADQRWRAHLALREANGPGSAGYLHVISENRPPSPSQQPLRTQRSAIPEVVCRESNKKKDSDGSHDSSQLALRPRPGIEATTNNSRLPTPPSTKRPIALLVDDNMVNLRILQMYCKKRGIPFLSATHGREAVQLFQARQAQDGDEEARISVVMMDYQMPECDGIEAARQMRQLEKEKQWPESVLFILTGQDNLCDKKDADEAGADEYYVKPVGIKTLDMGLAQYFPDFQV
ncbi:hypothetical protein Micbo1qcDRAFT_164797 [Microdochium bolleyi]|uniref:histidine kinase n=1 Tax=Microdochium bolleyi TaxID=196109 RepID=A0A136IZC4_9PEZI|nr:hypothetical protein Micbo1qcDRAFT_164797 [Microdochium bolleyi]